MHDPVTWALAYLLIGALVISSLQNRRQLHVYCWMLMSWLPILVFGFGRGFYRGARDWVRIRRGR